MATPLRASEFEHALHVGAEERRFESHFARRVIVDEFAHAVEYVAQLAIGVAHGVQVDVAQNDGAQGAPLDFEHSVTHVVGSRVDSHDAVCRRIFHAANIAVFFKKKAVARERDDRRAIKAASV